MADPPWTYDLRRDPDGTFGVEIVDEDNVRLPVARQLSEAQARLLVKSIEAEAVASGRPIKAVIRDHYFMASTVLTVKRR